MTHREYFPSFPPRIECGINSGGNPVFEAQATYTIGATLPGSAEAIRILHQRWRIY
jgi:hypothetical protein